jgi:hypothetical protein
MKSFKKVTGILLTLALLVMPMLIAMETPASAEGETLTIRGDGVEQEVVLTLAELEAMSQEQHRYTVINSFPTESVVYAGGIPLMALLERAGLKDSAQMLTFTASDGFSRTLTVSEMFAPRYSFPESGERVAVPAMVCLLYGTEGFDELESTTLRLIMGQRAQNEQNNPWFVRFLSIIEVSAEAPDSWPEVTFERTDGEDGVTLELQHPQFDSVKIYYTLDGSEPTVESEMYNVSATRFQPELNKPLVITENTTVRAIAIGPGRADSAVSSITISFDAAAFTDLEGYDWAKDAIEALAAEGIVTGVGPGRFSPGGTLNRAMFVTMLGRGLNPDAVAPADGDRRFPDVNYDSWYGPHVEWAVDMEIVLGHSDGTFRPQGNVTVEHMLLMADRAGLIEVPDTIETGVRRAATRAEAAVIVYALAG